MAGAASSCRKGILSRHGIASAVPACPHADGAARWHDFRRGKGDAQRATEVIRNLKLFTLAESGRRGELVSQPYSMTHASIPLEQRLANGIVPQLIRLSVGIEDPKDLIADLSRAAK